MISISIIIPVYNEESTILALLTKLKQLNDNADLEIIIINDGSTDKTKKIIDDRADLYHIVKNLEFNQGKGKAIIEGLKISTKDYVFFQDADLEYDPSDLSKFISIANNFQADFIMGSRFIGEKRSVIHFWHMIGNKVITFIFNLLNNTVFTDIYCCYCLFIRKNLPINRLKSKGWGQQAEILTYLAQNSKKTFETAVDYDGRSYSEGKKIRYHHVFEVIYWICITKIKVLFSK